MAILEGTAVYIFYVAVVSYAISCGVWISSSVYTFLVFIFKPCSKCCSIVCGNCYSAASQTES